MIRISFITIHPEFVDSYFKFGVFSSAYKAGIASYETINLRQYAVDRHGTVDGRVYGGGDGMILRPEPLARAVSEVSTPETKVWCPGPKGHIWNHQKASQTAEDIPSHIIIVCGRFGGIDQRFIDRYVDMEISIGDFVLSGGELAGLSIMDSLLRLVPGTLGHKESATHDSFAKGLNGQLESPQYTRPAEFEGESVPKVLTSGNHQMIQSWRMQESYKATKKSRPDLVPTSANAANAQQ